MNGILITSGAPSRILTDKRGDQIEALLADRPCEAVSMARKLLQEYPDDERTLAMCIRTALRAQAATGKVHLPEDLRSKARDMAEQRFFSPVFSVLGAAAAAAFGEDVDLHALGRAFDMGPEVASRLAGELMPLFRGKAAEAVRDMMSRRKP